MTPNDPIQAKRVQKQVVSIILGHPFFASLLLRLQLIQDTSIPTFATDGCSIFYNPKFAESLSDDLIRGVLAHEVLHPALGHLWRMGNRDKKLSNIAADYAINLFLDDYNQEFTQSGKGAPFPLPEEVMLSQRFRDKGFEEIYSILLDERIEIPLAPTIGEFTNPEAPDASSPSSANTQENWAVAICQAAHAAKMMGKSSACIERLVGHAVSSRVPWNSLLQRFMTELTAADYDWTMPDRRYLSSGYYLPGMRSETTGEIVFAIDTSGSVGEELLAQFLSEAEEVLCSVRPSRLVIIQCDSQVQHVQEFQPGDTVSQTLHGGGGTCFAPVFEEIKARNLNPRALVYLTDGYGSHQENPPDYPVMWVTYGTEKFPWGQVVSAHF